MKSFSLSAWSPINSSKWQAALDLLLEAAYYNLDLEELSHFSVATGDLRAAGLTENDIHWLIAKAHIAVLPNVDNSGKRRPHRASAVVRRTVSDQSRVFLTETGIAFAVLICTPPTSISETIQLADSGLPTGLPRWDRAKRILWVGTSLVKRFNVPAANQELILTAFAEKCWPECIDDPLPMNSGIDSKERLHDTIKRLNRGHECRLIRFRGNGNGLAVRWEAHFFISLNSPQSGHRSAPDRPLHAVSTDMRILPIFE